jgi:hypothetical protein
MSMFTLTSLNREDLPIEGKLLFGRGSDCDVRLKDPEVSRKHAIVYVRNNELYVQDEGSANGTFVNETRIDRATRLSAGDTLRMGNTIYTVEVTDIEDATATVFADEINVDIPAVATPPEPLPPVAQEPAQPSFSMPELEDEKTRSPLLFVGIGCGVLVLLALCGFVAVLVLSQFGLFEDLFSGFDLFPGSGSIPEYSLQEVLAEDPVDDRPGVISYLGLPDAFTISEIMLNGTPVRVESWRYFAFGTRVDFVDGEATLTMDIEPAPEDSILPAWYDPLTFELGMSQSEAAGVAAAASPAGMTPEFIDLAEAGDDLIGGAMLVGDQIVLGLDETGLIYVETIGLFPEGEGGS